MSHAIAQRPDLIILDERQRQRAEEAVRRSGVQCPGCGSRDLDVGDAIYLGFLFVSERQDAYMVGLQCRNPHCPKPRTALRLRDPDFEPAPAEA